MNYITHIVIMLCFLSDLDHTWQVSWGYGQDLKVKVTGKGQNLSPMLTHREYTEGINYGNYMKNKYALYQTFV